jgi:hypothetical protein
MKVTFMNFIPGRISFKYTCSPDLPSAAMAGSFSSLSKPTFDAMYDDVGLRFSLTRAEAKAKRLKHCNREALNLYSFHQQHLIQKAGL